MQPTNDAKIFKFKPQMALKSKVYLPIYKKIPSYRQQIMSLFKWQIFRLSFYETVKWLSVHIFQLMIIMDCVAF